LLVTKTAAKTAAAQPLHLRVRDLCRQQTFVYLSFDSRWSDLVCGHIRILTYIIGNRTAAAQRLYL